MVVVWKNTGHPDLVGQEIEFFKVTWTGSEWARDDNGKWWGMEHPTKPSRNIRLHGKLEDFGEVIEETSDISTSVSAGTPTLGVIDEEE